MTTYFWIPLVFFFTTSYGLQYKYQWNDCRRFISRRGVVDMPGTNETVYCLNQYLYQRAIERQSSNTNTTTSQLYIHELVDRALRRCNDIKKGGNCGYRGYGKRSYYSRCNRRTYRRRYRGRLNRCRYWTRKEVRVTSETEWTRFVDGLNVLKSPINIIGGGSFIPYDIISDVHMPRDNIVAAHGGPNFLSWHRIYLLALESALNVPIPYWDCRLDYNMEDPTKSIFWTPRYVGKGRGFVTNGPFSTWITPDGFNLFRNIGNFGTLITDRQIKALLEFKRHDPVVDPSDNITIERVHNAPHVWVGGQLSSVLTASQDPVFFMHHAFIDYIWYLFRKYISTDPEKDYPVKGPSSQHPFEQMIPFNFGLLNIFGYSNLVEYLTTYKKAPTCPKCSRSPHIFCNQSTWLCQSTKMPQSLVPSVAETNILRIQPGRRIRLGPTFNIEGLTIDPRTRNETIEFLPLIPRL